MKNIASVILPLLQVPLLILVGVFAVAQTPAMTNLTGSYTITWLGGGQPNGITLVDDNGTLTGTYTADNKEACAITGVRTGVDFNMKVSCTPFEIRITGYELHNARTNESSGSYEYEVYKVDTYKGSFVMDKIVQ